MCQDVMMVWPWSTTNVNSVDLHAQVVCLLTLLIVHHALVGYFYQLEHVFWIVQPNSSIVIQLLAHVNLVLFLA